MKVRDPQRILDDKRDIQSLQFEGSYVSVGLHNVTRIVAYPEPGMHCYIPFYAVYVGDEIAERVPAWMVSATYKDVYDKEMAK